jgi:hypothetical protein
MSKRRQRKRARRGTRQRARVAGEQARGGWQVAGAGASGKRRGARRAAFGGRGKGAGENTVGFGRRRKVCLNALPRRLAPRRRQRCACGAPRAAAQLLARRGGRGRGVARRGAARSSEITWRGRRRRERSSGRKARARCQPSTRLVHGHHLAGVVEPVGLRAQDLHLQAARQRAPGGSALLWQTNPRQCEQTRPGGEGTHRRAALGADSRLGGRGGRSVALSRATRAGGASARRARGQARRRGRQVRRAERFYLGADRAGAPQRRRSAGTSGVPARRARSCDRARARAQRARQRRRRQRPNPSGFSLCAFVRPRLAFRRDAAAAAPARTRRQRTWTA